MANRFLQYPPLLSLQSVKIKLGEMTWWKNKSVFQDQFGQHLCPDVKLKMYLYYGSERNKDTTFLAEQDVVLTTYNTLTVDYGVGTQQLNSTWNIES